MTTTHRSIAATGARTILPDEERLWRAIRSRDAGFDGQFYYGVLTTGVYCRPACSSRQPKRENVRFFALPEAARGAGLRPCKRCRPDDARPRNLLAELVQNACRLIDLDLQEQPSLERLSEALNVSRFHLQRSFKKVMGISPREYAQARRLEKFRAEIKAGRSVAAAIYGAGYGSSSRLYEKASDLLGMTPATYRRGGAGMRISYTTVKCPLGHLVIAATTRGICSVSLGDDSRSLVSDLLAEFPRADMTEDQARLREYAQTLLEYLEGDLPNPALPLDVQGTAFQQRVWQELRRIPAGETASYGDIAERLGRPLAHRAVAQACAANPVALVVPCHRVIRGNGEMGGYRWGVARKRALLDAERERAGGGR